MITFNNFVEIATSIFKCCYGNIGQSDISTQKPSGIEFINQLQSKTPHQEFLQIDYIHEGLQFKLKTIPRTFVILSDDQDKEDPPLHTMEQGKLVAFSHTSSVIVLTEYARYLFEKAVFKLDHKGFDIYPVVRTNFKLICKDGEYFNKIWYHKEVDCFALTDGHVEKIYFVTYSSENMNRISSIVPTKATPKTKPVFVADFISGSSQDVSSVYGTVTIKGYEAPLPIEIEKSNNNLTEKEISFVKSTIEKLTESKQDVLLTSASKQITEAAYSQSSNNQTIGHEALKGDFQISKIVFIEDEELLIFLQSHKIFPNNDIVVQVNGEFEILDISIS
jgi:hypothetical protein